VKLSHCRDHSSPASSKFHDNHLYPHLESYAFACAHLSAQTRSSLLVLLAHYIARLLARIRPTFTHLYQLAHCPIGGLIPVPTSVRGQPSQTRFRPARHLWNTILHLYQLLGRAARQDSRNKRDTSCGINYSRRLFRASRGARAVINHYPQSAAEPTRHTSRLAWGSSSTLSRTMGVGPTTSTPAVSNTAATAARPAGIYSRSSSSTPYLGSACSTCTSRAAPSTTPARTKSLGCSAHAICQLLRPARLERYRSLRRLKRTRLEGAIGVGEYQVSIVRLVRVWPYLYCRCCRTHLARASFPVFEPAFLGLAVGAGLLSVG